MTMAWTAPMTATANSAFTASQFNAYVRDNLMETAPAKATAAGQFFVSTGVNAIAARTPDSATVSTGETTTSTSFGNLTTTGPVVTATTGTRALVSVGAGMTHNTDTGKCYMGYAVSGASTIAADETTTAIFQALSAGAGANACYTHLLEGLTPGSNTFTAQYKSSGNTATFSGRHLSVIPF
jgi:hypothetical protein